MRRLDQDGCGDLGDEGGHAISACGGEVEAVGGCAGSAQHVGEEALGDEVNAVGGGKAALDAAVFNSVGEEREFEHKDDARGRAALVDGIEGGGESAFEVGAGDVGDKVVASEFDEDELVIGGEVFGLGGAVGDLSPGLGEIFDRDAGEALEGDRPGATALGGFDPGGEGVADDGEVIAWSAGEDGESAAGPFQRGDCANKACEKEVKNELHARGGGRALRFMTMNQMAQTIRNASNRKRGMGGQARMIMAALAAAAKLRSLMSQRLRSGGSRARAMRSSAPR